MLNLSSPDLESSRNHVFISTSSDWAVYSIDKTEALKLVQVGQELEDFKQEFDDSKLLFGIVRISDSDTGLYKIVYVSFLGDGVPVSSKGKYHSYASSLSLFFKGFHVHIQARSEADVEPAQILQKVKDASGAKYKIREMDAVQRDAPLNSRRSLPKEQDIKGYVSPINSVPLTAVQDDKQNILLDQKRARELQQKQEEARAREREQILVNERQEKERKALLEKEQREKDHAREILERERMEGERLQQAKDSKNQVDINTVVDGFSAVALYDYQKDEDNEIDLHEGENVLNVTDVGEGWYSGTNSSGVTGLFPGNYVQVGVSHTPGPNAVEKAVEGSMICAVAIYDYEAAEENEISFAAGDTITGITYPSDDWWHGFANGTGGLFPGNYVEKK